MLKLGDICPLFFNQQKEDFAIEVDYLQLFHSSDKILLQVIGDGASSPAGTINDIISGSSKIVSFSSYKVNDNTTLYYTTLQNLEESCFRVILNLDETITSEPFEVCSDSDILKSTCLIECSNKDNNSPFDNIFWVNGIRQTIQLRFEGGFKAADTSFSVSNEQFRNTKQEIIEQYAVPYEIDTLTIGDASGLPVWFFRMINKIFCLSSVWVDGVLYRRSEQSTPELEPISEYHQVFNASLSLELAVNDIAGVKDASEVAKEGILAVKLDNLRDGDALVYRENEGSFINTNDL